MKPIENVIVSSLLGVPAMFWIASMSSWEMVVAIFILMWANNISQNREKP